jgi:hypothetical protein
MKQMDQNAMSKNPILSKVKADVLKNKIKKKSTVPSII